MKCLAIIPARGGSKRIPHKNIKPFLGRPIIAYSIEAALGSGLFEEVMVSTDDVEIAEIARQEGASVPFLRSTENANMLHLRMYWSRLSIPIKGEIMSFSLSVVCFQQPH